MTVLENHATDRPDIACDMAQLSYRRICSECFHLYNGRCMFFVSKLKIRRPLASISFRRVPKDVHTYGDASSRDLITERQSRAWCGALSMVGGSDDDASEHRTPR